MIKLNVLDLIEKNEITRYQLYNKLNNIRAKNGEPLINYTNFQNLINQANKSVMYQDLDELCEALDCDISDLLSKTKRKK